MKNTLTVVIAFTILAGSFASAQNAGSAMYENEVREQQQKEQSQESVRTQSVDELSSMSVATQREKQQLQNSTLYVVAKTLGLNWKQDRNALATKFGIENYTGTREQNMKIKEQLLAMISVENVVATKNNTASMNTASIATIMKTEAQKNAIKKQPLFVIVKSFGFNWKTDRVAIAQALGITNYNGSISQNMEIKKALLEKIIVQ